MIIILRILLLLAVAWLAFVVVRRVLGGPDKVLPKSKDKPELMQRCAYCDVHLPSGEATQSRGKIFAQKRIGMRIFKITPTTDKVLDQLLGCGRVIDRPTNAPTQALTPSHF